jgi:hypothetical protein
MSRVGGGFNVKETEQFSNSYVYAQKTHRSELLPFFAITRI